MWIFLDSVQSSKGKSLEAVIESLGMLSGKEFARCLADYSE